MKIWVGYGSEHSFRLVMIGRFVDQVAARATLETFEQLQRTVSDLVAADKIDLGWDSEGLVSDELRQALSDLNLYSLGVSDVANFAYDYSLEQDGETLKIWTDEGEVQGFLKLLILRGARVEVFSSHDWTESGEPRPKDDAAQEDDSPSELGSSTPVESAEHAEEDQASGRGDSNTTEA